MKRTVVTGVGPVSAAGIGREEFFAGISCGESGILPLPVDSDHAGRLAATIDEFQVEDYIESSKAYLDRGSELALAATSLAIEDSGLEMGVSDTASRGLVLGSGWGSLATMSLFFSDVVKKGPRRAKPFLFPHTYSNTAISIIAIEYGMDGPHLNFSSGAVSGSCAILAARDLISAGQASVVFAGGYEAFNHTVFSAYDGAGVLSPGDGSDEICAPFDRRRNGGVLGEGAGVLVLEELGHAMDRSAHIYGEITGAGMTSDSTVGRDGGSEGVVRAMNLALDEASIGAADVDCVSANANGSVVIDRNEAMALQAVLGQKVAQTPVSSIKSMAGDTIGASGALQMIAALASIEVGRIPPTANLVEPSEGVELDLVVSVAREKAVDTLLMNSIDPGGSMISFALSGAVKSVRD